MERRMKHTDIGYIPADWDIQTFEETFRILPNNTLSRENLNNKDGVIRNIHYGDIITRFPEILDCSSEDIPYLNDVSLTPPPAHLLQDGDVVIADTAEDETVGKATEMQGLGNGRLVAGLHTIPCRVKKGRFAPGWLGYYMNSNIYHDQIIPFITGIKVSSISKSAIAETLILIPPFEEQKRIVETLSQIGELIKKEAAIIDKINAFKSGCLTKMFPSQNMDRPEMRFDGFEDVWIRNKLCDMTHLITKGTTPLDKSGKGEINFIKIENIDAGSGKIKPNTKITEEEHNGYLKRSQLQENDILFSIAGTLGRVGTVNKELLPANTNQALAIIRLKKGDLGYITTFLKGKAVGEYVKRNPTIGAQPNLSLEQVSDLIIDHPSVDEQKQISAYFASLDKLINAHQRKYEKYTNIKAGAISILISAEQRSQ